MGWVLIARVLSAYAEANVLVDPRAFVLPDGRLDFDLLLREFAAFWCENADILVSGTVYHEAAPQLVLMAFLQRVGKRALVNPRDVDMIFPAGKEGH